MKKKSLAFGALAASLLTASLMGVMYLADELAGLPFIPYDFFDWSTRILPGLLVTFGLDLMIDLMRLVGVSVRATAKTAERAFALSQFFGIGVVVGALFFLVLKLREGRPDLSSGLVVGALLGLPMISMSIAIEGSSVHPFLVIPWLALLFLAWGVALREVYVRLYPEEVSVLSASGEVGETHGLDRRQFLVRLGAATASITVASTGIGNLLAQAARRELEAQLAATTAHESEGSTRSPFPNADAAFMAAPGTRPEYTPLKDHYQVFLRAKPTVIDGATWTLPITGLAKNNMSLTIDDIRNNYEAHDQYVTISCISGRIGTDLISTTQWTGSRLQDILADVEPNPDASYLDITCGDGFHETVALDLIASDKRIMLCYAWDGHPLPVGHGFPLRIWLPDRYGMKQPKWITGIEVKKEYREGYWVRRGWSETAIVEATSVIDTVAVEAAYESEGQFLIPVGGIAFAGAREISKVEVRVDGGPWEEAILKRPLSETTWVFWRYDWPFEAGEHEFEVRCAEGDGTPQIESQRGNHPSGATGIHKKKAQV